MTTALGVAPDANGVGLDPLTHRLLIKKHWNNTGVVMGLTVSGRGDLKYQVSAGAAICSMSAADGYTEAYWNGGVTENAVDAGDSTYSRIDVVYMLSNTGTPDNVVHVMVQQGTPAASPAIPTLEAGAQPLAYRLMPANGSTTNSATPWGNIDYAIQSGTSTGLLSQYWDTRNFTDDGTIQKPWLEQTLDAFTIPTDRYVEIIYDCNFSANDKIRSEYGITFMDNGVDLPFSSSMMVSGASWENHHHSYRVWLAAGRHVIQVKAWTQSGSASDFHYGPNAQHIGSFVGRRAQVWDLSVKK